MGDEADRLRALLELVAVGLAGSLHKLRVCSYCRASAAVKQADTGTAPYYY